MGKWYTVCTVQIRKMPVLERYMHVYWVFTKTGIVIKMKLVLATNYEAHFPCEFLGKPSVSFILRMKWNVLDMHVQGEGTAKSQHYVMINQQY